MEVINCEQIVLNVGRLRALERGITMGNCYFRPNKNQRHSLGGATERWAWPNHSQNDPEVEKYEVGTKHAKMSK